MDARTSNLAQLAVGATGRVGARDVGDDVVRWLDALGITAGTTLTLLRRGVLGGPLHVRAESGAEFAIARELAAGVELA